MAASITSQSLKPPRHRGDFRIAIICAVETEFNAVKAVFDKFYEKDYGKIAGDNNDYTCGRIGNHDVVLGYPPGMGKASAASLSSAFRMSYDGLQVAFVVGVCGGVPRASDGQTEILLGDVIISTALIPFDHGRVYEKGILMKNKIEERPGRPSPEIRSFQNKLKGNREQKILQERTAVHLVRILAQPEYQNSVHPGPGKDKLFLPAYLHKHRSPASCNICDESNNEVCETALRLSCDELLCDESMLQHRNRLDIAMRRDLKPAEIEEALRPKIFFGRVGSGDMVMKSARQRDDLADTHQVIAFEMEGAGVWDNLPTIIMKGVSDYADSHKSKVWQPYAAGVSAACMKAALEQWQTVDRPLKEEEEEIPKAHFLVPFSRNPSFVGREGQLEMLQNSLTRDDHQRRAVCGLGGVGKTQIVLELAYRVKEANPSYSVFWMQASSMEKVEQAFLEIGQALKIPGIAGEKVETDENDETEKKPDVKQLVQQRLNHESSGPWLLILDNADDGDLWFKNPGDGTSYKLVDWLPRSHKGSIIWTTRDWKAALKMAPAHKPTLVAEMDKETATALLRKRLVDADDLGKHVSQLLEQLTYLPLAIVQATSYINENGISIAKYLQLFEQTENSSIEMLSEDFEDEARYRDSKNPVATTWLISFQKIQEKNVLAVEYLSFISCLDANRIPESILPQHAGKKMTEAIGTLCAYGFITKRKTSSQDNEDEYDLHRLVRLATRNWLGAGGVLGGWTQNAIDRLAAIFPDTEFENRLIRKSYLPHGLCLCSSNEVEQKTFWRSQLLSKVGLCLKENGMGEEGETLVREALQIKEELLGPEDVETIAEYSHLASVLEWRGKFREAEQYRQRAVVGYENHYGPLHPETLGALVRVGSVLESQGRYDEALVIAKRALAGAEEIDEPDHSTFISCLIRVGSILSRQGKYQQAEVMHRCACTELEKIYGPDHPNTLSSVTHLAWALEKQGKLEVAGDLHHRAFEGRKQVLGAKHPATLNSAYRLATRLQSQGKLVEAERIWKDVLEGRMAVFGSNHPATLATIVSLVTVLQLQGKYVEAGPLLQDVARLSLSEYADGYGLANSILRALGSVLYQQGMNEEAESIYRRALEVSEKKLGPAHATTLDFATLLGSVLSKREMHDEAVEMHRRAFEGLKQGLGPEDASTLRAMFCLASALDSQGKKEEAKELYQRQLGMYKRVFGPTHPDTLRRIYQMAGILRRNGNYREAEAMYREVLSSWTEMLGEDHPNTIDTVRGLGRALDHQKKYEEAEDMYRRSLAGADKVDGRKDTATLDITKSVARVLAKQKKYEESEAMYRQVISGLEDVLGPQHTDTLRAIEDLRLVSVLRKQYEKGDWMDV